MSKSTLPEVTDEGGNRLRTLGEQGKSGGQKDPACLDLCSKRTLVPKGRVGQMQEIKRRSRSRLVTIYRVRQNLCGKNGLDAVLTRKPQVAASADRTWMANRTALISLAPDQTSHTPGRCRWTLRLLAGSSWSGWGTWNAFVRKPCGRR